MLPMFVVRILDTLRLHWTGNTVADILHSPFILGVSAFVGVFGFLYL